MPWHLISTSTEQNDQQQPALKAQGDAIDWSWSTGFLQQSSAAGVSHFSQRDGPGAQPAVTVGARLCRCPSCSGRARATRLRASATHLQLRGSAESSPGGSWGSSFSEPVAAAWPFYAAQGSQLCRANATTTAGPRPYAACLRVCHDCGLGQKHTS